MPDWQSQEENAHSIGVECKKEFDILQSVLYLFFMQKAGTKTIMIEDIDAADFQPPCRTTPKALQALRDDIVRDGKILADVHLIPTKNGRYLLVDGHRRWSVARALGYSSLQAKVHDCAPEDAAILWARLNNSTRSVKGYEWMDFWFREGGTARTEKRIPHQVFLDIQRCLEIFCGKKGIQFLLDNGIAPSIANQIDMVHRRLTDNSSLRAKAPTKEIIGKWLIKHKAQLDIRKIIAKNKETSFSDLRKLLSRIVSDEPLYVKTGVIAPQTPSAVRRIQRHRTSAEVVIAIRERLQKGEQARKLAREFRVSDATVSKIKQGRL